MIRSRSIALALALAGCSESPGPVDDPSCTSGARWSGGSGTSPRMHPGRDCNGCHAKGVAPTLELAGTIYEVADEKDECLGVAEVAVRLVAGDASVALVSNDSGNLARAGIDLAAPYTVELELDGRTITGTTPHEDFDCAGCHTAQGRDGARGRIVAP